jgi:hypothetical protein
VLIVLRGLSRSTVVDDGRSTLSSRSVRSLVDHQSITIRIDALADSLTLTPTHLVYLDVMGRIMRYSEQIRINGTDLGSGEDFNRRIVSSAHHLAHPEILT